MSTIKISQLPAATNPVSDGAVVPIVDGGVTKKATIAQLGEMVSVKAYGATGDGTTNDTAAIQAAIDYVYGAGGGTVYFPPGTYRVTSIIRNWTNPITVNIKGSGKRSTVLRKFGSDATPVLDFSGIASMLEPYSEISDLEIDGNSVGNVNGLRATNYGRWVLRNVFIENCNYGLYCRGGLVFDVYDCTFQANLFGYYCEKSADNVYSNLVTFYGGQFSGNSQWGLYIKQAGGVHVVGTDISFNGTSGDTGTGGIYYDVTMDDEVGYAVASIKNAWFEGNFGNGIKTGAVGGLHLSIMDTTLAGNFNPITVGAIAMSEISNCFAGSVTDTIVVGAGRSIVKNCIFYDLIDNSTYYHHWNVVGNAYNDLNESNTRSDLILGSERFVQGSAAALTNVPATYSQSGTTVTVTLNSHGIPDGNTIYLAFTSGGASTTTPSSDGVYTVSNVTANTFDVTLVASLTTSGNVVVGGNPIDLVNFLFGSGEQQFWCANVKNLSLGTAAIGFYGTSPKTKQTVTGSAGGNAALQSLLTALETLGLITDSST
jgi:hypothetical protein